MEKIILQKSIKKVQEILNLKMNQKVPTKRKKALKRKIKNKVLR